MNQYERTHGSMAVPSHISPALPGIHIQPDTSPLADTWECHSGYVTQVTQRIHPS
jgi:hypothetical protein